VGVLRLPALQLVHGLAGLRLHGKAPLARQPSDLEMPKRLGQPGLGPPDTVRKPGRAF
jgi:hypothetical protein